MAFDQMDPVFTPQLTVSTPEYAADVELEIRERFGDEIAALTDSYALLADTIDLADSAAYADGTLTGFSTDDMELVLEEGAEPGMKGSLKTACSISDALVLQYYEEPDDAKAAFGQTLSFADWQRIGAIKDLYGDVLFTAPLVAPNVAHPLLQEIRQELDSERRFTFLCGHDSNVGSVLASLDVEPYVLPDTIESRTPIGCKLVFCRWTDADGEGYLSCDLMYQSSAQLRDITLLDRDCTPIVVPMSFKGLTAVEPGLYPADDLLARLDDAIGAYDIILDGYDIYAAAA